MRVIAVILIILVHVSAQKWYTTDVTSINWKIMHAYDNIGAIGNCIFVMISGTLFLDKKKKITSKYLRKKIFHLVVVYIFWQTAYFLSTNSLKLSMQFLKDIFFNLFDHYSHLWFLFMIAGIYFCVPIFRRLDVANERYFLVLSVFFTFLFPSFTSLSGTLSSTKIDFFVSKMNYEFQTMNFHLTLGWTPYFILGHYLANNEVKKTMRITFYMSGILSYLFRTFLTIYKTHVACEYVPYDYGILIFIESISIFIFCKYALLRFQYNKNIRQTACFVSSHSFGIYLVHFMVLNLLERVGFNTLSFNPLFSIPCLTFLVFILSLGLSFLIKRNPLLNKWVV